MNLKLKGKGMHELGKAKKQHETRINNLISKIDAEGTEQMKSYKQMINFFTTLGIFFGTVIRYDWKPKTYSMFWFTNFLLVCASFHIPYTGYVYYKGGYYVRIVEPLAIAGLTVSVISTIYIAIKSVKC